MQFDMWLNNEKYEMEIALGGCENMINFSYSKSTTDQNTNAKLKSLVYNLLRDICQKQFRLAYNKDGWLWHDDCPQG